MCLSPRQIRERVFWYKNSFPKVGLVGCKDLYGDAKLLDEFDAGDGLRILNLGGVASSFSLKQFQDAHGAHPKFEPSFEETAWGLPIPGLSFEG